MQPVGFPFLLSQNESGTTRGKMKGDKKNTHKKKKKKIPTPSSSRIIVPFQMIKKREKRKTSNSAQNNSTSLEFHMGEGENLGVSSFSLFLLFFFFNMFTRLPVAVVGVCSRTSDTWGHFQMSSFVSLTCVDSRTVDAVG